MTSVPGYREGTTGRGGYGGTSTLVRHALRVPVQPGQVLATAVCGRQVSPTEVWGIVIPLDLPDPGACPACVEYVLTHPCR